MPDCHRTPKTQHTQPQLRKLRRLLLRRLLGLRWSPSLRDCRSAMGVRLCVVLETCLGGIITLYRPPMTERMMIAKTEMTMLRGEGVVSWVRVVLLVLHACLKVCLLFVSAMPLSFSCILLPLLVCPAVSFPIFPISQLSASRLSLSFFLFLSSS